MQKASDCERKDTRWASGGMHYHHLQGRWRHMCYPLIRPRRHAGTLLDLELRAQGQPELMVFMNANEMISFCQLS